MNILFITLPFSTAKTPVFYDDLLECFVKNGDKIYVACANEEGSGEETGISEYKGMTVLRINTGQITGEVPLIKKGIATLLIDYKFKKAIKKYYSNISVDLILYPTPPITLVNTVTYVKRRTGASTYLLLKDIFPQNAVDLGMFSKTGIKGIIYKYFRRKEKKFYSISDYIGCMSPANVRFLLDHNPSVNREIVEVCPNSITKPVVSEKPKDNGFKQKYNIPTEAVVFLYGGNLGRPQGISFLVDCLRKEKDNKDVFFMIVGNGSEAHKVKEYVETEKPVNCTFLDYLPKEEYQKIADQCDVGMIFLDYHFTIPNFPSRVLNYLSSSKPILTATDPVCDMGDLAEENGFGVKCLSNDVDSFSSAINKIVSSDRKKMGENAWKFFCDNYTVEKSREIILSHYKANDQNIRYTAG